MEKNKGKKEGRKEQEKKLLRRSDPKAIRIHAYIHTILIYYDYQRPFFCLFLTEYEINAQSNCCHPAYCLYLRVPHISQAICYMCWFARLFLSLPNSPRFDKSRNIHACSFNQCLLAQSFYYLRSVFNRQSASKHAPSPPPQLLFL